MQRAGQPQKRGKELTVAGELESLANVRLVDLTPERINKWASAEVLIRASSAQLTLKMLRAFPFWCARHHNYKAIILQKALVRRLRRFPQIKQRIAPFSVLTFWVIL
jgi:hypothetical protein